jgi:hypothetical protein
MADYRVHIIRTDGHLLGALQIVCPDDESAKQYATQLVDGHDIELWQGDRKIITLKHTQE